MAETLDLNKSAVKDDEVKKSKVFSLSLLFFFASLVFHSFVFCVLVSQIRVREQYAKLLTECFGKGFGVSTDMGPLPISTEIPANREKLGGDSEDSSPQVGSKSKKRRNRQKGGKNAKK